MEPVVTTVVDATRASRLECLLSVRGQGVDAALLGTHKMPSDGRAVTLGPRWVTVTEGRLRIFNSADPNARPVFSTKVARNWQLKDGGDQHYLKYPSWAVFRLERGAAMSAQHEDLVVGFSQEQHAEAEIFLGMLLDAGVDQVLHRSDLGAGDKRLLRRYIYTVASN